MHSVRLQTVARNLQAVQLPLKPGILCGRHVHFLYRITADNRLLLHHTSNLLVLSL